MPQGFSGIGNLGFNLKFRNIFCRVFHLSSTIEQKKLNGVCCCDHMILGYLILLHREGVGNLAMSVICEIIFLFLAFYCIFWFFPLADTKQHSILELFNSFFKVVYSIKVSFLLFFCCFGIIWSDTQMDLETENRLAAILMKEAAELRRQSEREGVLAYLRKPDVRTRPNSRFLTATVRGVQQGYF